MVATGYGSTLTTDPSIMKAISVPIKRVPRTVPQRKSHDYDYGYIFDLIGAPGRIRTSDPLVRRMGVSARYGWTDAVFLSTILIRPSWQTLQEPSLS